MKQDNLKGFKKVRVNPFAFIPPLLTGLMTDSWPPLLRYGVVGVHIVGVLLLSLISLLFYVFIALADVPAGDFIHSATAGIELLWAIQIIASLYAIVALLSQFKITHLHLLFAPLGLLSLATGLLFIFFNTVSPILSLLGLFSLLYAITNFQTFRMLIETSEKKTKKKKK